MLNVGAGVGAYEPADRPVVALEPSFEMIAKRRRPGAAVQGTAEHLPFRDGTFDCSMGLLTLHHWSDIAAGLREMRRVTKNKIVLFTWTGYGDDFWLEEYLPEIKGIDIKLFPAIDALEQVLGNISVEIVEIPHDCTDGFMCAYWRRPVMYLDSDARKAISTFVRMPGVPRGLEKLREDIESGAWHKKHRRLLEKESIDLGYRLVVGETP